jgi:peptidylprolyl isomerase
MRKILTCITLLAALTIVAVGQAKMQTTKSGLKYSDLTVGTGDTAMKGNRVQVHYTGWLYVNGKRGTQFDSSVGKQPFDFKLGNHDVIAGWDEGVEGMKVGGKRELIIPPDIAYGNRAVGGVIPANSTLDFEVELLKVSK